MFAEAPKHSFEWYTVVCTLDGQQRSVPCILRHLYHTIRTCPLPSPTCALPYTFESRHQALYHSYMYLHLQISKNSCMSPSLFRTPLLYTAIKMSKRVSTAQKPPTDHSSLEQEEEEETNINLSIFLDILRLQRHSPRRQLPVSPKAATPKSLR